MGYFTKGAQARDFGMLTQERLTAVLDAHEINYGLDDDNDVGAWFDGHPFYLFRHGKEEEILYARGRWNRRVDLAEQARLRELINTWHREKLWPKGYTRVADDGTLNVFAEVSVDYEFGLSDDQLWQHVDCAVSTILSLFAYLDEHYPAEAATAKAELDA